jgi:hypothetical protein
METSYFFWVGAVKVSRYKMWLKTPNNKQSIIHFRPLLFIQWGSDNSLDSTIHK